MLMQICVDSKLLRNVGVGLVKNGCGNSDHRTLKLTVFQEWIDGINWFFAWWYKSRKAKSCCYNYWMSLFEDGRGFLSHGTLKSAVSKEWSDELSWIFACWCKFKKAKNYCISFRVS